MSSGFYHSECQRSNEIGEIFLKAENTLRKIKSSKEKEFEQKDEILDQISAPMNRLPRMK